MVARGPGGVKYRPRGRPRALAGLDDCTLVLFGFPVSSFVQVLVVGSLCRAGEDAREVGVQGAAVSSGTSPQTQPHPLEHNRRGY